MPPALHLELLEDRCVPTVVSLGPTEVGIFNQGTWTLDINDNHNLDSTDTTFVYGLPTDTPVTGDWTASGHTAVGVFRNVNGVGEWILDINNNHVFDAGDRVFFYGLGTDTPITGDWSGNGNSKVGVFRNVNGVGEFILNTSGNDQYVAGSDAVFFYGNAINKPVAGDWNGDGIASVGVFQNKGGGQFVLDFNDNHVLDAPDQIFLYGVGSDTPVIGDWSGSSQIAVGVVRDNGRGGLVWSLDFNNDHVFDTGDLVFNYGPNTAIPVTGNW